MALSDTLRKGIATANKITKSLQLDVFHYTWVASVRGKDQFITVIRKALVEQELGQHQMPDGRLVQYKAKLTFLETILPNGADGRSEEPIDPNDRFGLPDGTVGRVLDAKGMLDSGTNRPFLIEVWLN